MLMAILGIQFDCWGLLFVYPVRLIRPGVTKRLQWTFPAMDRSRLGLGTS